MRLSGMLLIPQTQKCTLLRADMPIHPSLFLFPLLLCTYLVLLLSFCSGLSLMLPSLQRFLDLSGLERNHQSIDSRPD